MLDGSYITPYVVFILETVHHKKQLFYPNEAVICDILLSYGLSGIFAKCIVALWEKT